MTEQRSNPPDAPVTDEGLAELARKFEREGIPEAPPKPSGELQPHLTDDRVYRIQEKMWLEFPILAKYVAMFATTVVDPPWEGTLPTGQYGVARHPVAQFIISSDHPRPIQRKYGVPHVSLATAWKQAWDDAEKERRQFVTGGAIDPAEQVFRGLSFKHANDLKHFEEQIS